MSTLRTTFIAALLALVLGACAADDGASADTDEIDAPDDGGKADSTSELRVRAGDTTLWLTARLGRDGDVVTMHGRTSRDLAGGYGFVNDDPYGDFAQASARSFDVTWTTSTLRSLVDGVDQFVSLQLTPGAGHPDSLTARVVVRPRLVDFAGSTAIYLTPELTPVVVGGRTVYRMSGHSTTANTGITVVAGGVALPAASIHRDGDTRFTADLDPDAVIAIAGVADQTLSIVADRTTGGVEKTAHVGLAIKKLGLTTKDAYATWPRPTCTAATRACLAALPSGSVDLGSCGEAIVVNACAGQVGQFTDADAIAATLAKGDALLAAPAFQTDAVGLVGADHVSEFTGGAREIIADRVGAELGRWTLSPAARDVFLAAALAAAVDAIYARPLAAAPAHPPVAGDPVALRQVIADALLDYLAGQDYLHSEFGRPLEDLCREYRAQHVASVRAFRETAIEPLVSGTDPGWDVYVGDWLGAYTEVSVERATGKPVNVLVELD